MDRGPNSWYISPEGRTDRSNKDTTIVKGKKNLKVYTDSQYVLAMIHVHSYIYRARGLLTAEGRTIKNKQEVLDLLQVIRLPQEIAVIH